MEKLEDFLWAYRIKTKKNKLVYFFVFWYGGATKNPPTLSYSHFYLVIHKNIKIFVQHKIVQKIGTAVSKYNESIPSAVIQGHK